MFGDTLLESSSASRKRKRWPMATAFTVEAIIAGVVVMVPLLSTGVIPVSARPPLYTPVQPVRVDPVEPIAATHPSGPASSELKAPVVIVGNTVPRICLTCLGDPTPNPRGDGEQVPYNPYAGTNHLPSGLAGSGNDHGSTVKPGPRRIVSVLSEAQLVNRVEPVYPRIAVVSGIQGQVKLHAIIARDGTIQSLNVISGHPLLVRAAAEAVGQWRYRPYVLNGEAVEVETFITVNFRKDVR